MLRFTVDLEAKAGACAPEVWRKDPKISRFGGKPLIGKISLFYSEIIFMTTPIHILCSNFKEIGRREVGKKMHCFGDKIKSSEMRFFTAKVCRGACHLSWRLHVKCPDRFWFAELFPFYHISSARNESCVVGEYKPERCCSDVTTKNTGKVRN